MILYLERFVIPLCSLLWLCRRRARAESYISEMLTTPFHLGIVMQLQQILVRGAIGLAYEGPDVVVPAKQREQALRSALDGETRNSNPEPSECFLI